MLTLKMETFYKTNLELLRRKYSEWKLKRSCVTVKWHVKLNCESLILVRLDNTRAYDLLYDPFRILESMYVNDKNFHSKLSYT